MSEEQKTHWWLAQKLNPFRKPATTQTATHQVRRWRPSRRRMVFWSCAILMSVGVGVYVRAEIHRRVTRLGQDSVVRTALSGGTLLISGGGQLPPMIRQRFVELAGGHNARIVVIPAEVVDESSIQQYRDSWDEFQIQSVEILNADSRTQADDPEFSKALESATGVWLGGGQQTWLAAWYGRTLVESRLKELLARNGVIGGTSAGAAVMSRVMIAGGREKPTMGLGFDLIPGCIIDQHFIRRNRLNRLRVALEQHPDLVGFGIDEGAALEFGVESGSFRVLGQSTVVACVPQPEAEHPLRYRMEFFNAGDSFSVRLLRDGSAVPPSYVDLESILLGE